MDEDGQEKMMLVHEDSSAVKQELSAMVHGMGDQQAVLSPIQDVYVVRVK